ncbi:MAG: carbon-nitrogen hydrolase family protein, partial [Gammaproteobacteria bacterium]
TLALGSAERGEGGPLRAFLSGLARAHGIWLVGGTIPVLGEGERPRAACILYAPDGSERARYDKIHLFDVDLPDRQGSYRESDRIEPGTRIVTADTPFGVLGLAICYDLRFPEFFRVQFQRGMTLMVLPSAFTRITGEAHWHALLRARAIENQCWVVAPNQGGRQSATRESYGGSVIVDPWGRVLASAGTGEAVLLAPLDPAVHAEARGRLPVDAHQRLRVPDQELSPTSDRASR